MPDTRPPHLPFASPSWLDARKLTLAAVLVAAVGAAVPVTWPIPLVRDTLGDDPGAAYPIVMATTGLLSVLLVRRALRASTPRRVVLWCVIGAPLLGILNSGLACAILAAILPGSLGAFEAFGMASLFGSVFAAPLGLVFGGAFALLAREAHLSASRTSHEGFDVFLRVAGIWLSIVLVPLSLVSDAPLAPVRHAAAALGVALIVISSVRIALRRAFVRRVRAGAAKAYRIVPLAGAPSEIHLRPLFHGGDEDGALASLRVHAATPYRAGEGVTPLAVLPLED